jgi:hypothetical protein
MKESYGITDNSPGTQLRYDIIAEKQVEAYSRAIRKQQEHDESTEFILNLIGKIIWYLILFPILTLLKMLIIWVYDKIRAYIRKSTN